MLIETMIICSLTLTAPFYDCDQKWIVYIYDEVNMNEHCKKPDDATKMSIGCAGFMNFAAMDVFNMPKIWIGSSTGQDKFGYTNLEHEIEHIKCRCNFHE